MSVRCFRRLERRTVPPAATPTRVLQASSAPLILSPVSVLPVQGYWLVNRVSGLHLYMYINFKFSVPIGRFQSTSKNARNSFLMIFHSPRTGDCSAVTCLRPVCSNGVLVTPPGECCPECMASEHSSHTYIINFYKHNK